MATRFLNDPVRLQLREKDSATGSYPTIARTGDANRSGRFPIRFDDTRTVKFYSTAQSLASPGRIINYPEMLIITSPHLTDRPRTGSIVANGVVRSGLGDHLAVFSSSKQDMGPFIEDMMPEQSNSDAFFMTGTADTDLPGFSSPLKSKTTIRIDISPTREQIWTRNPARHDDEDPSGAMVGLRRSGFAYFNHSLQRWEDIGLTDPATGLDTSPSMFQWTVEDTDFPVIEANVALVQSGTELWCQQFTAADMQNVESHLDRATQTNLKHVARPTVTMQAPFANRYHATASQAIHMGDHINHPFLLEKVVITLGNTRHQVEAQRIANWQNSLAAAQNQSAERYGDDYTFFLYRQRNTHYQTDSAQDVSGSERHLIFSASMCFYNGLVKRTESALQLDDSFAPLHTPAFAYDFEHAATPTVAQFSGSVTLRGPVQTVGPSLTGWFRVTASFSFGTPAGYTDSVNTPIYNYWPGGTVSSPFLSADFTGREQGPGVAVGFAAAVSTPYTYAQYDATSLLRTHRDMGITRFDPRAHAMMGKGGIPFENSTPAPIANSPHLLFPSDKLVIGMDSLLGLRDRQRSNELTGSLFRIPAGTPCSIALYGSLVRDGVEFHDTLNQNLTSEAVHEDLHFDNPTVDQFEIHPRSAYSGTFIDNVLTGTITSPNLNGVRGVVGSVSSGSAGVTGSIGRHSSFWSPQEMFYDSIPPKLGTYISASGGTRTESTGSSGNLGGNAYVLGRIDLRGSVTRKFRESNTGSDAFRMPFPYSGNPSRVVDDNAKLYILKAAGGFVTFEGTIDGDLLIDSLFRRGQKRKGPPGTLDGDFFHAHITGSQGFRYGMISNKPVHSRAVFRHNRFGQLRDMLEQRQFTTFFDATDTSRVVKGRSQSVAGKRTSAVSVKFVSGGLHVPPNSASDSSNRSFAATSSIPYFDNIATN